MASAERRFRIRVTSRVSEEKLARFLANPLDDDLLSVPSLGDKSAEKLAEQRITNTTQLIGKFLMLKRSGCTIQQHCDAFYTFLLDAGLASTAASVTLCIAEYANKLFPGIFNAEDVEFE